MKDQDILDLLKLSLYSEAKTSSKSFPVGTTPELASADINDLNEVDICHSERLRIKCFYSNLTKSQNPTAFYKEITKEEYPMWVKACTLFHESTKTFHDSNKLNRLREKYTSSRSEVEAELIPNSEESNEKIEPVIDKGW